MLVKIISLKFDSITGSFDDTPIRDFTQDKEILQVRDHLFIRNEIPYLILIVKYYPYRQEAAVENRPGNVKQTQSESWKRELKDGEIPLFNQLRDWRSERCKKDGVPPYLIFTNNQLALVARGRPQSMNDLTRIEGIGRGKVDRYGADILAITQEKENEVKKEEKPNG